MFKINPFLLLLVFNLTATFSFSQDEIKYITPPPYVDDFCKIKYENILSTTELCKLKLTFENNSKDRYFVYRSMETGLIYGNDVYYPTSKKKDILLGPKEKGYKVLAQKGEHNHLVPEFKLQPKCYMGIIPSESVKVETMLATVGDESEFEVSNIEIKVKKVQLKKEKFSFMASYEFVGDEMQILQFDPRNIVIMLKDSTVIQPANISNKVKVLKSSEKGNFKFNLEIEETELILEWGDAFKIVNLEEYPLPAVTISNKKTTPPKSDGLLHCSDRIFLQGDRFGESIFCTVVEITKNEVIYRKCSNRVESKGLSSISKMDIVAVDYPDRSRDVFDYSGKNNEKVGLKLTRSKKEVMEKQKVENKDKYKK